MKFKSIGPEEWQSDEGYKIQGSDVDGFEAFAPDGSMVCFWSIDIPHAKDACEEHLSKQKGK